MKETIYTIPINEALEKQCFCPLCEMYKDLERSKVKYAVGPVYAWSLVIGFMLGIKLKLSIIIVLAVMMFKRFIKRALAIRRVASGTWLIYNEIDA